MSNAVESTAKVVESPKAGAGFEVKEAADLKSSQEANSFNGDQSFSTGNTTAQDTDFGSDFEKSNKGETSEGGELNGINKKMDGSSESMDNDNTNNAKNGASSKEIENNNTSKDSIKIKKGEGLNKDSKETEGGEKGEAKQIPTDKSSISGKSKGEGATTENTDAINGESKEVPSEKSSGGKAKGEAATPEDFDPTSNSAPKDNNQKSPGGDKGSPNDQKPLDKPAPNSSAEGGEMQGTPNSINPENLDEQPEVKGEAGKGASATEKHMQNKTDKDTQKDFSPEQQQKDNNKSLNNKSMENDKKTGRPEVLKNGQLEIPSIWV